MPMIRSFISARAWGYALCTAGALTCATATLAAGRPGQSEAQRAYERDRAACLSGQTHQDRATCLREAGAALQEARRGGLDDRNAEYERNRLLRCEKQPPED